MIVKKATLTAGFAMMAYSFILEAYYYFFVGRSYSKFGFNLAINEWKYIETKMILIFIISFLILISRRSQFIYASLVVFTVLFLIPATVVYAMNDQPGLPMYSIVLMVLAVGIVSSLRIRIPSFRTIRFSKTTMIVTVCLLLLPFLLTFGFYVDLKNILLLDVYKTRAYFDEHTSTGINYFYHWMVKVIIPVLAVYFLIKGKKKYAFWSLVMLLYLYLISGNKIVFITAILMVFFYVVAGDYLNKIKWSMLILVLVLMLLPLIDAFILGQHSLKGTFVMRMLFLPAQLNHFYLDFFDNKPLYFAESTFFNLFSQYPYAKPVGFVIAEKYFHVTDMNANNGIISDGFMNLGIAGIGLNILIITIVFLFFNSANPDPRYFGVFCLMIFLFLSAPMLSIFVTSGLWLLIILAITLMRQQPETKT